MTTVSPSTWARWNVDSPPPLGYAWVPGDSGAWRQGLRTFMEYREVGMTGVSEGLLTSNQVRVKKDSSPAQRRTDWHYHDVDFEFFYVLKGSITIETQHGEIYTFGPGGAGCVPGGYWHRESGFSGDYEAVDITSPGVFDTIHSAGDAVPEPVRSGESRPIYTFDTPDEYVLGAGPRSFFRYRDLGSRRLTEGRVHTHVVRASEAGAGTGWHYHTMAQWFMVVGGSGYIRHEDKPLTPLSAHDAMCIGAGANQRHDVGPFSADYAVLEMCIPEVYDTIAVQPPAAAAAAPEGMQD